MYIYIYIKIPHLITGVGTPPKDYTKPRQTIQRPKTLYKDVQRLYKDMKY